MLARLRLLFILLMISVSNVVILYFAFNSTYYYTTVDLKSHPSGTNESTYLSPILYKDYNIWLIFTKVFERSPLKYKFTDLIENLINISSVRLNFNIIVDNSSKFIAENVIAEQMKLSDKKIIYNFYNIEECVELVKDIVEVSYQFFSKPGSYYRDVLFHISLGLHRFAPKSQKYAILMDCDVFLKKDVAVLFDGFKRFKKTALFGLAPELSPVYRHILKLYRSKHKNTTFGDYYHWNMTSTVNVSHPRGFQGYNSGVLFLNLDSIRNSLEYGELLKVSTLLQLTQKYYFKGYLGDQDFYTLIGYEYPHLIQTLNCGFNKQLCTRWRDRGYGDIFDNYARCNHDIVVLHGNCNTKIPK